MNYTRYIKETASENSDRLKCTEKSSVITERGNIIFLQIKDIQDELARRFSKPFAMDFHFPEGVNASQVNEFHRAHSFIKEIKDDEKYLNRFIGTFITMFKVLPSICGNVIAQGDDEILPDVGLVDQSSSTVIATTEDVQPSTEIFGISATNTPKATTQPQDFQMRDILERMIPISQDTWSSTDPAATRAGPNAPLLTFRFPDDIITGNPIIEDKLRNFRYMRADLEFRVKLNATPFQQGCLAIVYQPFESLIDPNRVVTNLPAITSFPHSIINLDQRDEVTMRLPFCSDEEYFDLENADRTQFGEVRIYVLSALMSAIAPDEVAVSTFARFVNPKVHGPYVSPNDALSGVVKLGKGRRSAIQSRQKIVDAQADNEQMDQAKTGMVTKISGGVHAITSALSPVTSTVPILSAIVPALSWASNILHGVAEQYGWSKATSMGENVRYTYQPASNMVNYNGKDNSVNFGAEANNAVDVTPAVSSKYDEMDFGYIFRRKFLQAAETRWESTDVVGASISNWFVTAVFGGQDNDATITYGGPLEFISAQFQYWRGGLEYEIHIIKTKFHTGRFVIMFNPMSSGSHVASLDDMDRVYCKICDISQQSVFKFSVPYVSATPYMNVINSGETIPNWYTGRVVLRVLNPLKATSTVADSVGVLVYKSGADDFEVACPQTGFYIDGIVAPADAEEVTKQATNNKIPKIVQAQGDDMGEIHEIDSPNFLDNLGPIGENSLIPSTPITVDTACMGERISSVRQMIKRFKRQDDICTAQLANKVVYAGYNSVDPYIVGATAAGTKFTAPSICNAFLYRFFGGSHRLKMVNNQWTLMVSLSRVSHGFVDSFFLGPQQIFTKHNDIIEMQVPHYSRTRLVVIGTPRERTTSKRTNNYLSIQACDGSDVDGLVTGSIYTAAGDDMNYSFLVGPPGWRVSDLYQ